jgi:hypothetical protein
MSKLLCRVASQKQRRESSPALRVLSERGGSNKAAGAGEAAGEGEKA